MAEDYRPVSKAFAQYGLGSGILIMVAVAWVEILQIEQSVLIYSSWLIYLAGITGIYFYRKKKGKYKYEKTVLILAVLFNWIAGITGLLTYCFEILRLKSGSSKD